MSGLDRPMIFIGYDPREISAFAVTRRSVNRHLTRPIPDKSLIMSELQELGLYTRPTERRINDHGGSQLWDVISDAPMATEFANTRFLAPILHPSGWSLFMDCDMLVRGNIARVFELCRDEFAVMCVKHDHRPAEGVKMDGQIQTAYGRKNWSSFMLVNGRHPSNKKLTLDLVNTARGRDLHQFCWLEDHEIGELPVEWNWLVGHSDPSVVPMNVHFTDGVPAMEGYENVPFAEEWRRELAGWAGNGQFFGSHVDRLRRDREMAEAV